MEPDFFDAYKSKFPITALDSGTGQLLCSWEITVLPPRPPTPYFSKQATLTPGEKITAWDTITQWSGSFRYRVLILLKEENLYLSSPISCRVRSIRSASQMIKIYWVCVCVTDGGGKENHFTDVGKIFLGRRWKMGRGREGRVHIKSKMWNW